jgi:hypothetical protein
MSRECKAIKEKVGVGERKGAAVKETMELG